jgi:hypothetical protein
VDDPRLTALFVALGAALTIGLAVALPTRPLPGPRLASLDAAVLDRAAPLDCTFVRVTTLLAGGVADDPRLGALSALRAPSLAALGRTHLLDLDDGVACAGATHHSPLADGRKLAVHLEGEHAGRRRLHVRLGSSDVLADLGPGEPLLLAGPTFAGGDLIVVIRLGHATPGAP